VLDLYSLDLMGRFDMLAVHQVDLLAALMGRDNVESTYLHLRDVARHLLLIDGSCRGRVSRPCPESPEDDE
jgi:hypothetical protein